MYIKSIIFIFRWKMASVPYYHLKLDTLYKEEDKCKVHRYCIHVKPQVHYNANKHASNNSCTIPTKEGKLVNLKITNERSRHGASVWDIMCLEPITYNTHIHFDHKYPALDLTSIKTFLKQITFYQSSQNSSNCPAKNLSYYH
jgi:hypothetical protein